LKQLQRMLERAAVAPRLHPKGMPRAEQRRSARGPRLALQPIALRDADLYACGLTELLARLERLNVDRDHHDGRCTEIHAGAERDAGTERITSERVVGGEARTSSGAEADAATAGAVVELGAARQPALALLTAGIAQHHVVGSARAGCFLLCMPSATVPDALSEGRHGHLFRRTIGPQLGAPPAAIQMPLDPVNIDADFSFAFSSRMELSYRFLS
jgi:hypothetical protein